MAEPTICGVSVKLNVNAPLRQVEMHPKTWMEILAQASEGGIEMGTMTVSVPLEEVAT